MRNVVFRDLFRGRANSEKFPSTKKKHIGGSLIFPKLIKMYISLSFTGKFQKTRLPWWPTCRDVTPT